MNYSLLGNDEIEYISGPILKTHILKSDIELAKLLTRCDNESEYYSTLPQQQQIELKQYCSEILKYGGRTHELAGGKVFTDNTLLKPARRLIKSLKRKKSEAKKQVL